MKTRCVVGIALGIIIIAVGLSVFQHIFSSSTGIFERLVVKPIPKSVQFIERGKCLTMDSTFWVLCFQISKIDLQSLLDSQHFVSIDEGKEFRRWDQRSQDYVQIQKEEYFKLWQERIQSFTKLHVNFSGSWQIFTLKESGGQKYIFTDTNSLKVVFVANAH